jgi:hypothetical protein
VPWSLANPTQLVVSLVACAVRRCARAGEPARGRVHDPLDEAERRVLAPAAVAVPVLAEVGGADGRGTLAALGGGSPADTLAAEVGVVDDACCGWGAGPDQMDGAAHVAMTSLAVPGS